MKLVIDISKDRYDEIMAMDWVNCRLFFDEEIRAIHDGKVLPKGHGRLIDADAFERRCMFDSDIEDMQDVIYALRDYKPIIKADNGESEDVE